MTWIEHIYTIYVELLRKNYYKALKNEDKFVIVIHAYTWSCNTVYIYIHQMLYFAKVSKGDCYTVSVLVTTLATKFPWRISRNECYWVTSNHHFNKNRNHDKIFVKIEEFSHHHRLKDCIWTNGTSTLSVNVLVSYLSASR